MDCIQIGCGPGNPGCKCLAPPSPALGQGPCAYAFQATYIKLTLGFRFYYAQIFTHYALEYCSKKSPIMLNNNNNYVNIFFNFQDFSYMSRLLTLWAIMLYIFFL